jgi:hypothetical protein
MPGVTFTPTPSSPTPTVNETAILIAAVNAGLIAEHGPNAGSMNITVSQIQGNYAKGMASASGGGGIWFAAKVGDIWKLVFDGNGTVQCSQLTNYPNFPNAMIPECWDAVANKTITR